MLQKQSLPGRVASEAARLIMTHVVSVNLMTVESAMGEWFSWSDPVRAVAGDPVNAISAAVSGQGHYGGSLSKKVRKAPHQWQPAVLCGHFTAAGQQPGMQLWLSSLQV